MLRLRQSSAHGCAGGALFDCLRRRAPLRSATRLRRVILASSRNGSVTNPTTHHHLVPQRLRHQPNNAPPPGPAWGSVNNPTGAPLVPVSGPVTDSTVLHYLRAPTLAGSFSWSAQNPPRSVCRNRFPTQPCGPGYSPRSSRLHRRRLRDGHCKALSQALPRHCTSEV